jgi:PKD repeat protein
MWLAVVATLVATGLLLSAGGVEPSDAGATRLLGRVGGATTDVPRPSGLRNSSVADRPDSRPAGLNASPTWVSLSSPDAPPPQVGGAMAYDPYLGYGGETILFGGHIPSGDTDENQTWVYNSGAWNNLTGDIGHAPPPRSGASFALDSSGELVLFGGSAQDGTCFNDTWVFDGTGWANLTSGLAPPARQWGAMTWDSAANEAVLFGGESQTGTFLNDTWTYDAYGAPGWTLLSPAGAPSPRGFAGFVDDLPLGGALLFGGRTTPGSVPDNDTELFANDSWTALSPPSSPSGRANPAMVYNPDGWDVLLFGGFNGSFGNIYYNDTWSFNGSTWAPIAPTVSPSPRGAGGSAYDPGVGFLEFGGAGTSTDLGDTWTLDLLSTEISLNHTSPSGPAPLTREFWAETANGSGPYNDTWHFGDGSTGSGTPVAHTYDSDGTYDVTLTAVDAYGTVVNAVPWTILVSGPLDANLTSNVSRGAAPLAVAFHSTAWGGYAPYQYGWTFGDSGSSTLQDPTHTFLAPGNYTVGLNVTDRNGTVVGESVRIVVTEAAAPPAPPLTASISAISEGTTGTVRFTATSSGGYPPYEDVWWLGAEEASHLPSFNETFAASGTYAVELATSDSHGATVHAFTNVSVDRPVVSNSSSCPAWALDCGPLPTLAILAGAVVIALLVGVLLWGRRPRGPGPPPPSGAAAGPALPAVGAPSTPAPPPPSGGPGTVAGRFAGPAPLSDRLLDRLYELGRPDPNAAARPEFTQDGLAASLGTVQGGIARSLQRLEDSGLIASEVAHVAGQTRRRKVYRLTPQGESAARRRHPS